MIVKQLQVYISGPSLSATSIYIWTLPPPPHPTLQPIGHHRAQSWAPYVIQRFPTIYFVHGSEYIQQGENNKEVWGRSFSWFSYFFLCSHLRMHKFHMKIGIGGLIWKVRKSGHAKPMFWHDKHQRELSSCRLWMDTWNPTGRRPHQSLLSLCSTSLLHSVELLAWTWSYLYFYIYWPIHLYLNWYILLVLLFHQYYHFLTAEEYLQGQSLSLINLNIFLGYWWL